MFEHTLLADGPDPSIAWNVVLTIGVLVSIGTAVITAVIQSRRSPPLPEELYRDFVRRSEWNERHAALDARIGETFEAIDSLRKDTTRGFTDTERALGRIEGKLGGHTRVR